MSDTKQKILNTTSQIEVTRDRMIKHREQAQLLMHEVWALEDNWRELVQQWHEEEGVVSPFDNEKSDTVVQGF